MSVLRALRISFLWEGDWDIQYTGEIQPKMLLWCQWHSGQSCPWEFQDVILIPGRTTCSGYQKTSRSTPPLILWLTIHSEESWVLKNWPDNQYLARLPSVPFWFVPQEFQSQAGLAKSSWRCVYLEIFLAYPMACCSIRCGGRQWSGSELKIDKLHQFYQ